MHMCWHVHERGEQMIYLEYHGEIKPCPYCESNAGLFNIGGEYAVRCKSNRCRLESDAKSTKDEAVSYWNKRVNETLEAIAKFNIEMKEIEADMEKSGIFYGLTAVAQTKEDILTKRRPKEGRNAVTFGQIGSGMSFTAKAELGRQNRERKDGNKHE